MKKILLTILVSLCLGTLLSAIHISFATKHIINDKKYSFENFISVFDSARDRLNIVSKSVMASLSVKHDADTIKTKDILDLYNNERISIVDATVLQTLTNIVEESPNLIKDEYVNDLSYLSLNNNTLFYRIKPVNRSSFKNAIACQTSDYCALLYYNAKLPNINYTYDILQDPSGNVAMTLTRPLTKDETNIGSLILDIPVANIFNAHTYINKEYYNGKNVYSFSDSDIPVLQFHQDYPVDAKTIVRLKVSYLNVWFSKSYLIIQYSSLIFFILFLILKKRELDRLTRNIVEGKESFYDAQFNKLVDDIAVYNYDITESRHLEEVVKTNAENSLILVKYNLDEAKTFNVVPQAHSHIIEVIGSFIRGSDYIIKNTKFEDELIILLPKCSTENATRVLNKILYKLSEEAYSGHELKLKATRLISNIQDTVSIDSVVAIAQDEIFKIGGER